MNVSLHAEGSPSEVRSAIAAQAAKEKTRVPGASAAIDAVQTAVEADIAHVGSSDSVAVSVSITVHRPDPAAK